ncbi:primosomal replication protein N'', partial [Klebsiella pneumoniae]
QRQLAQATSLDEQQRLGKEVEAYSGRLARCRQALDKIENVLARLTR